MRITFIGLGEAASAIISGWGDAQPGPIRAFDIKTVDPATAPEIAARAERLGVTACASAADALKDAELVFCMVTADQAVAAAGQGAPHLPEGAVWCDMNSCAPSSKQRSAATVEAAGGRYLDVAVLAPVYPLRNMVPCLVSGPDASRMAPVMAGFPMDVRVVSDAVGRASSIKMVRSIMVKGLEALTAECVLAAVAADVADEVFPSLKSDSPRLEVLERAAYNFERMLVHGKRRAAEMDEVAKMLADLGLPGDMSTATAHWQRVLSGTDLTLPEGDVPDHLWFASEYLKRLLPD
ncbi:NAD(P)-dependent oxidoreductase [Aestuariicoccus sp. MJ-SS9]|uniref:NAD(P)-dependent oxidoreductase n=1 Tax=Aestuariicoccus sp. MJ-SS9 TaxID=3079855 RepID=UPI002906D620|nr:DUF1932 domain-containing protein [Aestuariicoccus sp. MJ-SS9]MDU8909762.1 DUF1932 domain-containing protein [Aestuariicoccus sp. MJ-SS9]